jgi:hypothetical protein
MRLRWNQVFVNTWDWNRIKGNFAGFYINKKIPLTSKLFLEKFIKTNDIFQGRYNFL